MERRAGYQGMIMQNAFDYSLIFFMRWRRFKGDFGSRRGFFERG